MQPFTFCLCMSACFGGTLLCRDRSYVWEACALGASGAALLGVPVWASGFMCSQATPGSCCPIFAHPDPSVHFSAGLHRWWPRQWTQPVHITTTRLAVLHLDTSCPGKLFLLPLRRRDSRSLNGLCLCLVAFRRHSHQPCKRPCACASRNCLSELDL